MLFYINFVITRNVSIGVVSLTGFLFSAVLKSSSVLDLHQLHSLVIRMGYENHEYVLSSLVMAYSKNDFINEALSFIQEFNSPLPVIPSNIIAGIYNRTGQYNESMKLLFFY